MAQAINTFILTGNLTKDPEGKTSQNGKKFCYVNIAVNGISKDKVDFISVLVWEKLAENVVKYCKKGDCVSFIGSISTIQKDGKSAINLTADAVTFLHKAGAKKADPEPEEKTETPAPSDDPFATW